MAHNWNFERTQTRINTAINEVSEVSISEYTRDMSLKNIPKNKAYRTESVHLYIDIFNMDELLGVTATEGETSHKKTLKFLNLHYRAVDRILDKCDALRIDFHNQRLHAVILKPYGDNEASEKSRINKAIAIGQLISDVLQETGDENDDVPNAKVRIGIDSGKSLIVNNGRNGGREPLFLGNPANQAAKLSGHEKTTGIYVSNNARKAAGIIEVTSPNKTALSADIIKACVEAADLDVSKDVVVKEWLEEQESMPIGNFEFSRHTPPLRTVEIETLSPKNSRRQELLSIYADIDGFTNYVNDNIEDNPEDVVRTLHVLRSELACVLTSDFEGLKIRYIGDCLHGEMCSGTAYTTDEKESISDTVLCAGAFRSSFDQAIEMLKENNVDTGELGLAIGFEYGPTSTTRLGLKGDMVRCALSKAVLESEAKQRLCNGLETESLPLS